MVKTNIPINYVVIQLNREKNLLTLVRMSKSRSSNSLLMTATIGLVPWTLKDVLPPVKKSKSKPTVDGKYKQMISKTKQTLDIGIS